MRSPVSVSANEETTNDQSSKHESFFENQSRLSQFEAFASDQPLNTHGLESVTTQRPKSTDDNDEPWELEDHSEENLKPIPTNITQKYDPSNSYLADSIPSTSVPPLPMTTIPINEDSEDEENDQVQTENYDHYFSQFQNTGNNHSIESPSLKTVRFSEKLPDIAVITPKNSLNVSDSSTTTSDSDGTDDDDDDDVKTHVQTNQNHFNGQNDHQTPEVAMRNITPRPESNISLTESVDLPPPLPPLPPMNNKPSNFLYSKRI